MISNLCSCLLQAQTFQISRKSAQEGCQAFAPVLLHQVRISVTGWVDPMTRLRPEGLYQWNIPMTPPGIEIATFRLVAQCLNQLRHGVPLIEYQCWLYEFCIKCKVIAAVPTRIQVCLHLPAAWYHVPEHLYHKSTATHHCQQPEHDTEW